MSTLTADLDTKKKDDVAAVMDMVAREHLDLQRRLEQVERAASAARSGRPADVDRLHTRVWELYLAVDDHLFLEEKYLAPLLDHAAGVRMILEHNDQRAALLALVEDSEADLRPPVDLANEAIELVVRLRSDMVVEEQGIATLGFRRRTG